MEMQREMKFRKFLSKKGVRMTVALLACMFAMQLLMTNRVMAETEGVQDTEEAVEEITLMYMDANGEFAQKTVQKAFSELSEADLPECPEGEKFTGWVRDGDFSPAFAQYEGKRILFCFGGSWCGENGTVTTELYPCCWWIDIGDDVGVEMQEMTTEYFGIPEMYPGLQFTHWHCFIMSGGSDTFYGAMVFNAQYANAYITLDYGELALPDKIVVGESGTKVILPTECEGYTDLVWQVEGEIITELTLGESKGYMGQMVYETVTCVSYTPSADAKDQEPELIPPAEEGEDSTGDADNGTGAGDNGAQTNQPGQTSQPGQASSDKQPSGKEEIITTTVNGVVVTQKEVTQSDLNNAQKNILGTYFTAMQNIEQDVTLSAEQKQNKKAENVQAWINSALGVNNHYKQGVYGVYELKASDLSQTIPIMVNGVKAGDKAVIAHLKTDGTWESVAATEVKDGVVYAKFNSLSPVFVAVMGNSNSTVSPKTGDADMGIFMMIAAVAALGIAVCVRRKGTI